MSVLLCSEEVLGLHGSPLSSAGGDKAYKSYFHETASYTSSSALSAQVGSGEHKVKERRKV